MAIFHSYVSLSQRVLYGLYGSPLGVQQQKESEYQATPGELLVGNSSSAWDVCHGQSMIPSGVIKYGWLANPM